MLSRDQLIEIEATRLWRKGFRIRKVTSILMNKYGIDQDEAKDFARIGRSINLGKFIPDWLKRPPSGSENVKSITPRNRPRSDIRYQRQVPMRPIFSKVGLFYSCVTERR